MDIISCFPADELAAAENDAIHYFEQLRERDEEGDEEETADLLRRDPDYDPNDSLYRGQYCAARRLHAGLLHSYGVAADLVPELWVLIIGLLNIVLVVYICFTFDVSESLCAEPLLSASCHSELSAFAIRARLPSARTQQRDFGKFDVANMAAIGLNHVVSSFRDACYCLFELLHSAFRNADHRKGARCEVRSNLPRSRSAAASYAGGGSHCSTGLLSLLRDHNSP
jgi:hypothetical protein